MARPEAHAEESESDQNRMKMTQERAAQARRYQEIIDSIKQEIRPQLDAIVALEKLLPTAEELLGRVREPKRSKTIERQADKIIKRHGVFGRPGVVVGGPDPCPACGVACDKTRGPGGYRVFHRAPCGLPCHGANLARYDADPNGAHSAKNCPRCKQPAKAEA